MSKEITQILDRISGGNEHGMDELVPLVYDQMRKIACSAIQAEPHAACDATELVHEAWIRLVGNKHQAWQGRAHFYGACAVVIRRILVDQARARNRQKRGGDQVRIDIEMDQLATSARSIDVIALDEALVELETLSSRQARLVELRFFGGLSEEQASEVLNVSRRTLSADWVMARAWLKSQLQK